MRHHKIIIISCITILFVISFVLYRFYQPTSPVSLSKASFAQLPHWEQDSHVEALLAFKQSCIEISKRHPNLAFGPLKQSGNVSTWQTICSAAARLKNPNDTEAKQFFETWFQPYYIQSHLNNDHLFTGYYIPLIHASLKKDKAYATPIYGLPNDIVKVNLSTFNATFPNKTLIGQLSKNNVLLPYPDRSAIYAGAIHHSAPVLAWANNEMDVFFAQIQGSAFIELPNKKQLLLSYAGTNGRPYIAIGKTLIQLHAMNKEDISMQSIRTWLEQHPEKISAVLNSNPSYIFFKLLPAQPPTGNEGVPLTPERSLAVDNHYIALGTPLWLDTVIPNPQTNTLSSFQHLMIAQDTGGAIKGAVRGDVFWGTGDTAAYLAGHMQSAGQYWVLLPRQTL